MTALAATDLGGAETRRRSLLCASDELLGEVEELRLDERRELPEPLREAIRGLQLRLGRPDPPVAPSTVRAAHDLVFAVQQRLMAANPRTLQPRSHPGRGSGQPIVTKVAGGSTWKLLVLPGEPPAGPTQEWMDLVRATVERAWDRWAYAQHHAVRSARERRHAPAALARARLAWRNYWELTLDAERLLLRIPPPAWPAAPRR
jgi:hypothetical protein